MKRYAWILLVLLFLTGCGENVEPDTIPTTQETTVPPETSCYVVESTVEKDTNGAVLMYDLPDSEYLWLTANGDRLMLASQEDNLKLTQGSGHGASFVLDEVFLENIPVDHVPQTTLSGVAFYDAQQKQAVFVRPSLQQYTADAPEIDGLPIFSPDGNLAYYCKGNEIRVVDLNTGIDRMLKSHSCAQQHLAGIYFDGTVLGCRVTDEAGEETTAFISAQTGQTIAADKDVYRLDSNADAFFAFRKEGTVEQRLFGTRGGQIQSLNLPAVDGTTPVLALNGVVAYDVDESGALQLSLYDLETGKLCAFVTVEGAGEPKSLCADKRLRSVWFLAKDPRSGEDALYQWKVKDSKVADDTVYAGPYYYAEAPDEEGLARLRELADDLGDQHYVDIRIWEDAVKNPGTYTLEAEYQTAAIEKSLTQLDAVLSQYPEKFLYKSVNRKIRICIVRSISREITGVQYWHDSDAYIVLAVGCDFADAFAAGMGYVVDSHVLGNSSILDDWVSVNPDGFVYGETPDDALLEGPSRAFADEASAMSVAEDRSRIFYYAMRPGNEAVFESDIMQSKLQKLCQGIRAAWRWKNVKDAYPWEQYLNESIIPE